MSKLLFKLVVGGVAALLGWMIIEPSNPGLASMPAWSAFEVRLLLTVGVLMGVSLGALDGYLQGSRLHMLRGAGLGLIFGGIGMMLGYTIGGSLSKSIFGGVYDGLGPMQLLSRTLAIAPAGAFLGLGIGASTLNGKRTWQSGLGGLIGGAVGGLLFNVIGQVIGPFSISVQGISGGHQGEVGQLPRALTLVIIGACIGLFIGLVELVSRTAWVRLVLGRNEGKEWPIDAPQTFIGRSERAGVPLFGDDSIAPMHACIIKQGNIYSISDGGSPAGTYLNGQRIQSAALVHGSEIQVGSYRLQFLMKHGAAPVRGAENFNQAYAIQNQPAGSAVAYGGQPVAYPTQQMPTPQAGPAPGSLYGSAPTQAMPPAAGGFPAQQPTVAFPAQGPASQPTMAYQPAPGGFTLAALDGPLAGQRYPVRGVIELGRESMSVPMSFDSNASRRHASISPGPMGVMVADLGSTNGTFVNGQRVQSANAGPGDLIKIGGTTFRVEPG